MTHTELIPTNEASAPTEEESLNSYYLSDFEMDLGDKIIYTHEHVLKSYLDNQSITSEESFDRALQDTFRASFKFSAGSPYLQFLLQFHAARILSFSDNKDTSLKNTAMNSQLNEKTFVIPRRHARLQISEANLRARSNKLWQFYMEICQHLDDPEAISITAFDEMEQSAWIAFYEMIVDPFNTIHEITKMMILKEINYLEDGRPNRTDDASRYRSLIKDCAIDGKPSGSREFDCIMVEITAIIRILKGVDIELLPEDTFFGEIRVLIDKLETTWKARTGTDFFPATVNSVAKRS